MATTVKSCRCESSFQDNFYGKGRRLHNVTGDGLRANCTICGKGHKAIAKIRDKKN